jgi:hypothetical protein
MHDGHIFWRSKLKPAGHGFIDTMNNGVLFLKASQIEGIIINSQRYLTLTSSKPGSLEEGKAVPLEP